MSRPAPLTWPIEDAAGTDAYQAFLEAKIKAAPALGLPCELDEVATHRLDGQPLRDHQRHIIRWGVEGGRRAYFLLLPVEQIHDRALDAGAVKLGRRGAGVELNPDYFRDALFHLRQVEAERAVPSLFDLIEAEDAAEVERLEAAE